MAIFSGASTAAAITTSEQLYVWGANYGMLGDGTTGASAATPRLYNNLYPTRSALSVAIGHSAIHVLYDSAQACNGFLSDDPFVCNHRGTCTSSTCVCNSGYSGNNCQIFTCNNVLSTDSTVCSGNMVSAGTAHTLTLTIAGLVHAYGDNTYDQL
jgi:alpha-tubulin suppressor-like RCC1 family protein